MKKSIILLIFCIVAFCCPVQAQHMKFMGIPLTGTITQFQSKLQAKGVKYDKTTSDLFPAGTRAFTGTFAGEEANIYVHYNPVSKLVYDAKAVVGCESETICDQKYNEFKTLISSEYDAFEQAGYQDGHEMNTYVIAKENATSIDDIIGYISIYVSKADIPYPYEYYLHIEYADHQNSQINDESKMNDL